MVSVEVLKEKAQIFWEKDLNNLVLYYKVAGYKGIWELKVVNVYRKNFNNNPAKYLYYLNESYPGIISQQSSILMPININIIHNSDIYDVQISDEDPINFIIEQEIKKLESTLYHPLFMQRISEDIIPLVNSYKIEGELDENFIFVYYPIIIQGETLLRDNSITLEHKRTKDKLISLYVYDPDIVEKIVRRGKHLDLNKRDAKIIVEKARQIIEQYSKTKDIEEKFKDMKEKLDKIKKRTKEEIAPSVEQYRAILYKKKAQLDV